MQDGILLCRGKYTCCYYHGEHVIFYKPSEHIAWCGGKTYHDLYLSPNYMFRVKCDKKIARIDIITDIPFKFKSYCVLDCRKLTGSQKCVFGDIAFGINGIFIEVFEGGDISSVYVSPSRVVPRYEQAPPTFIPIYVGYQHVWPSPVDPSKVILKDDLTGKEEYTFHFTFDIKGKRYEVDTYANGTTRLHYGDRILRTFRALSDVAIIDGKMAGFKSNSGVTIFDGQFREYSAIEPITRKELVGLVPCLEIKFLKKA